MADDLVTWLREQIEMDERVARWVVDNDHADSSAIWTEPSSGVVDTGDDLIPIGDSALARHIIRHDPRSVLTQCEAHTALLDAHTHGPAEPRPGAQPSYDFGCADCHTSDDGEQWGYGWCASVRALALAYQHRDGYRPEWRA